MRKGICFISFFLFGFLTYAQDSLQVIRLRKAVKAENRGSDALFHFNTAYALENNNLDSALWYTSQAARIAEDQGLKDLQADALSLKGYLLSSVVDEDESLVQAFNAFKQSQELYETLPASESKAYLYLRMAVYFYRASFLEGAQEYNSKAIGVLDELGLHVSKIPIWNNMAVFAFKSNPPNFSLAESVCRSGLKVYHENSVEGRVNLRRLNYNLAKALLGLGQVDSARIRHEKALSIAREVGQLGGILEGLTAIAEMELDKELPDLELINSLMEEAALINKRFQSKNVSLEIHKALVRYYEATDEPLLRMYALDSVVRLNEVLEDPTEIQQRFRNSIDLHTLRLNHQLELEQARAEMRRVWIIALIVIFFLLLTGLLYFNKKNREHLELRAIIKEQEFNQLRDSFDAQLYKRNLEAQLSERERIAQDLHDQLSSQLYALSLKLEDENADPSTINLARESQNSVRSIAHDLLPDENENKPFVQSLELLVDHFQTASCRIDLYVDADAESLSLPVKAQLFHIVQEALSNISKHAGAESVSIQLSKGVDRISLQIEDNGKGFDPEKVKRDSMGLRNIRKRAQSINAEIEIDSQAGKGSCISLQIPFDQNDTNSTNG